MEVVGDQYKACDGFGALGVHEQLVEACSALGWKAPTPIQIEAIPLALDGRDIIGLAQTGSGKTAAFVLPILQALLEKAHPFFACVLSPTRELAIQIGQQFEALGCGVGLKCAVVVGGVDVMSEMIALGKGPHVVVGTPGRFAFHLSNTKGFNLRGLKFLVLDEADRLLDLDFEKEMDEILRSIPRERQTFLYSATMTKKVAKLQKACLKSPAKVHVSSKHCTVDTLRQEYLFIPFEKKDCCLVFLLHELAGNITMVFTKTCKATRRLHLVLRCLGLKAVPISGKMTQPKRLAALNKFKAGDRDILICTDVASRGLDISSVDLVINYDIPTSSKDYIHRVGRTARAGRSGRAISLVTQYDLEYFLRIESALGKKLPGFKADSDEMDAYQGSVSEAQRMAIRHMREHDDYDQNGLSNGKRKSSIHHDDENEFGGTKRSSKRVRS